MDGSPIAARCLKIYCWSKRMSIEHSKSLHWRVFNKMPPMTQGSFPIHKLSNCLSTLLDPPDQTQTLHTSVNFINSKASTKFAFLLLLISLPTNFDFSLSLSPSHTELNKQRNNHRQTEQTDFREDRLLQRTGGGHQADQQPKENRNHSSSNERNEENERSTERPHCAFHRRLY